MNAIPVDRHALCRIWLRRKVVDAALCPSHPRGTSARYDINRYGMIYPDRRVCIVGRLQRHNNWDVVDIDCSVVDGREAGGIGGTQIDRYRRSAREWAGVDHRSPCHHCLWTFLRGDRNR